MQKKHLPQGAAMAAVDLWLGSAGYTPFYHGDTQLYDNTINSGCPMSIKNKFSLQYLDYMTEERKSSNEKEI